MPSIKKYPLFVRFVVPEKDYNKFDMLLKELSSNNNITDNVFFFTHSVKDNIEEKEVVMKVNVSTERSAVSEGESDAHNYAHFLSDVFKRKELKKFFPAYVEDPS